MKGRLELLDRSLAVLAWVVAAALGLMLFIGPQIVAEDKPSAQPAAAPDGEQLFAENCGGCHALSAAGTSGQTGPALDGAGLSADFVAETVSSGRGLMPSFSASLDEAEIEAVASFVEGASAP